MSWGVLGRLGAVLGASWTHLGAVCGALIGSDAPTAIRAEPPGRYPPKSLANPSPPRDKGPNPHFSTPFPCNPFPSSSFPFPSLRFPCLPLSWPVLASLGSIFLPNLAPTWLPKSTQIQTKWSLGGLPYLDLVFTSIFVRFLLRTWTPQTQKIIEISFVL